MDAYSQLHRKQNQMFILTVINFVLFVIMFTGIGVLTWQALTLVNKLKITLEKTEQTVAHLQHTLREFDTDLLAKNIIGKTTERLSQSLERTVTATDYMEPMTRVAKKLDATQQSIEETGTALQEIRSKVQDLDNEEIARRISYNILKGLGDGFQEAAESHNPAKQTTESQ